MIILSEILSGIVFIIAAIPIPFGSSCQINKTVEIIPKKIEEATKISKNKLLFFLYEKNSNNLSNKLK